LTHVAANGLELLDAVAEGGDLSGAHKGEVQRAVGSLHDSLQEKQPGVTAMHGQQIPMQKLVLMKSSPHGQRCINLIFRWDAWCAHMVLQAHCCCMKNSPWDSCTAWQSEKGTH
jgi:hypothetical protein